ncbi:MAG: ABC transporter ATP-binding protein [Treponema sp.]|nr:MAG: ABC transporter ATP-binding protein [Treponema sp.]
MCVYDISILSLLAMFLLLLIPLGIMLYFKVNLIRSTLIAVIRMTAQLFAIGIFLQYIFKMNNLFVNLLWLLIMIIFASFTAIKRSELSFRFIYAPIFFSFLISNIIVVLYFNIFFLNLSDILNARYLIAISGMLLGNSLRSNIIGISDFYDSIKRNENRYLYKLSMGAGKYEILMQYISKSITLALKPTIASIAVTGLVSLPGMMTGQILGGSAPIVAIKYQLAIMIAILTATAISIVLSILFTVGKAFDSYGILRRNIFKKN